MRSAGFSIGVFALAASFGFFRLPFEVTALLEVTAFLIRSAGAALFRFNAAAIITLVQSLGDLKSIPADAPDPFRETKRSGRIGFV